MERVWWIYVSTSYPTLGAGYSTLYVPRVSTSCIYWYYASFSGSKIIQSFFCNLRNMPPYLRFLRILCLLVLVHLFFDPGGSRSQKGTRLVERVLCMEPPHNRLQVLRESTVASRRRESAKNEWSKIAGSLNHQSGDATSVQPVLGRKLEDGGEKMMFLPRSSFESQGILAPQVCKKEGWWSVW